MASGDGQTPIATSKVLIIYTVRCLSSEVLRIVSCLQGGTIGMVQTDKGYAPAAGYLAKQLQTLPIFQDSQQPAGTMPVSSFGRRVKYDILEYSPVRSVLQSVLVLL